MLKRVTPTSAAAVLELVELLRGKLHVAFAKKAPRPDGWRDCCSLVWPRFLV